MLIHVLVLNCVAMIISISITTIISSVEKHGIHRQKDLNKFYSNLLKNNISMGAYNVKANTDTTSEGREDSTTTDQARDNDRDSVKEKKTLNDDDDGIIVKQKRKDLKRLHEEEDLEESTVNETAERSKEVQNKVEPSAQDNHDVKEEKQENTKKKHAEKRNNVETVMAARERYLARKRMKQEAQQ